MKDDNESQRIAREAAKELLSSRCPEYLPFFDMLWNARGHPEKMANTRGLETAVAQQLVAMVFPIVTGLVTRLLAEYVDAKRKKNATAEAVVKIVIADAKSKHPEVSMEILQELEKILPRIVERHGLGAEKK
jgi:hypothetical protein